MKNCVAVIEIEAKRKEEQNKELESLIKKMRDELI